MSEEIFEGNKKSRWKDREPYAYWKGNPKVAEKRKELLKCNVSDQEDWNARIFIKVPHLYLSSVSKFTRYRYVVHKFNHRFLIATVTWRLSVTGSMIQNRLTGTSRNQVMNRVICSGLGQRARGRIYAIRLDGSMPL